MLLHPLAPVGVAVVLTIVAVVAAATSDWLPVVRVDLGTKSTTKCPLVWTEARVIAARRFSTVRMLCSQVSSHGLDIGCHVVKSSDDNPGTVVQLCIAGGTS